MARPQKKYHYIYKIICNLNGKYYIGMHSASNLEDGYMGSGKRLRYSIRKHGIENHTKEILEFLEDRESLAKREAEIVNEELINDPLCMNLKCGGFGGGRFWNEEHRIKNLKAFTDAGREKQKFLLLNDTSFKEKITASHIKKWQNEEYRKKIPHDGFKNKQHSDATRILMKLSHEGKHNGDKNSQFGTCWITNDLENRKIKKGDLIPDGWRLGRSASKA